MMYIIGKRTRDFTSPYTGPTCEAAGILPGMVYTDKAEAEKDAELLSQHNPVGFEVKEYPVKQS